MRIPGLPPLPSAATVRTALKLGRVSNLPTVWTNVLAGLLLNGGVPTLGLYLPLALAASLFYVAGMYLNDAYDHRWDERFRPERPIPAGEVAASDVFAAGYGMMAAGLTLLALASPTLRPLLAGIVLCGLIVVYDVSHKGNPLSPVVMGLCRVGLYVMAGLAAAPRLGAPVYVGSAVILGYLILLSAVAKEEARRPGWGRLVAALIAGISLLDGALLLAYGHPAAAALAAAGFPLTRIFQRRIAGT